MTLTNTGDAPCRFGEVVLFAFSCYNLWLLFPAWGAVQLAGYISVCASFAEIFRRL